MRYVVVVVDGRGSNYKGRKFRNPVRGRLGYWEPLDQVSAARYESSVSSSGVFLSELSPRAYRHIFLFLVVSRSRFSRIWAEKPYVDEKRIGIWGWVRWNLVFIFIANISTWGADFDRFVGPCILCRA